MILINKRCLAISIFSLSCLNLNFFFVYFSSRALATEQAFSEELFQTTGLDVSQINSVPPWERPSDGTTPYVLPPWGLTVNDFVVTRQMPLSSGRREVLLASPSTGSEQRLFINLPNSEGFELYEMAFNKVIVSEENSSFSSPESRARLQNFNVKFSNNRLSEVVFADGTNAQISTNTAVIKSPTGETLETFRLQGGTAHLNSNFVALQKSSKSPEPLGGGAFTDQTTPPIVAQANNTCEENTQRSMDEISNSMSPWSAQMSSSSSELVQAFGWAIGHGSETLKNSANLADSRLPELTCRPPVQCDERRVSGGSEIRTDLFDVPTGSDGGKLEVTYEFYTIPDSIEIYYNGRRESVGPVSGSDTRTFDLQDSAQQVGITLRGNNNSDTLWWYTISCDPSEVRPVVVAIRPMADGYNGFFPDRLNKNVWMESSSGNIDELKKKDFCIVEKLQLSDEVGNPIFRPNLRFPEPWLTTPSPQYVAIWGSPGINCNTVEAGQNPQPGGIDFTSDKRARFRDAHGLHGVDENNLISGSPLSPLYIRQEYYWYHNGETNLKPLLNKEGKPFVNLLKRWLVPEEISIACIIPIIPHPEPSIGFYQHVEVHDISADFEIASEETAKVVVKESQPK